MAVYTKTQIANIIRDLWESKLTDVTDPGELWLLDHCTLKEGLTGENYTASVKTARGGGVSPSFATALAATAAAAFGKWSAAYYPLYRVVYVENEALAAASEKGEGAVVDVLTEAVKDAKGAMRIALEQALQGNGSGCIGIVSGVSATTITLTQASQAINFYPGQVLVMAENETTGDLDTGSVTVFSVNPIAGTVVCTGNVTDGIAAAAANRYIYESGYRNAVLEGIRKHLYDGTRSGSVTVQGIAISANWTTLAGIRVPCADMPISEALNKGMEYCNLLGARPAVIGLPPGKWNSLANESQNVRVIQNSENTANVGFQALMVNTRFGALRVECAQYMHPERGFGLPKKEDIELIARRKLLHGMGVTGENWIPTYNAPSEHMRFCSLSNLVIRKPNDGVVWDFSAST